MSPSPSTLRTRLTALLKDPRVKALSLLGVGGQVSELLDLVVAEVDRLTEANRRQAAAIAELERQVAAHAPRRINPVGQVHPLPQKE